MLPSSDPTAAYDARRAALYATQKPGLSRGSLTSLFVIFLVLLSLCSLFSLASCATSLAGSDSARAEHATPTRLTAVK